MPTAHIDYETFSELDIKTAGGYKYAMHSSTEILMASYALDHGPVSLWVPAEGEPLPDALRDILLNPEIKIAAFNAQFERLITKYVLNLPLPINRFVCAMVHAWSLGFSGGLSMVGDQIGLAQDKKKTKEGMQLIQRFCKPAPKNHNAVRYDHINSPEQWARFKEYCIQDTIAEREVEHLLAGYPLIAQEYELWCLDQEINDRGLPIDVNLVRGACTIELEEKAHLKRKLSELTGLDNGNSRAQLIPWLDWHGVVLDNLQKATVEKRLKDGGLHPLVAQVLQTKLDAGKTSTTKWHAFARATGDDWYLRGMFAFGGAQRTQRWAGRIVQLQNLKSPQEENPDKLADMLVPGNRDLVEVLWDDVIGLLSETIRCAITAPSGHKIVVSDLKSIESVYLGWMSGCARINSIFAEGKDTYKDYATELFKIAYEDVTKEQRKYSKPPTLGCGYQLGGKGLVDYAEGMGVVMTPAEAKEAVDTFRRVYPEIPAMWHWLTRECTKVIKEAPGLVIEGYTVRIFRDRNFMFIQLPSGRKVAYYQPLIQWRIPPWEKDKTAEIKAELDTDLTLGVINEAGWRAAVKEAEDNEKPRETITYMGMCQFANQWKRITTHGGKITENIVQAGARDVLAFDMKQVNATLDVKIVGHVHDELITIVEDSYAVQALADLERTMSITPPWAPGLLLGADGFITQRYKKG